MPLREHLAQFVRTRAGGFLLSVLAYSGLTAVLTFVFDQHQILDVALLYLMLTLVVAAFWGYGVGLTGAVLADLLVNFFFVPPVHTFTVQSPPNVLALAIFLSVAMLGATMLARLQRQAKISSARAAETAVLLRLTREISHAASPQDALGALCRSVVASVRARSCAVVQLDGAGGWQVVGASGGSPALSKEEQAVASESVRTGSIGRLRRTAQPSAPEEGFVTFVPFGRAAQATGVLRIRGRIAAPPLSDQDALLRAFADEASLAVHRSTLSAEAQQADVLRRADEFKTALLSSVSHDLRSPLTAIKAAVGSLRDGSVAWSDDDRRSFLATIEGQTDRLTATVDGLLQMSRLEGGAVRPALESLEAAPLLHEAVVMAADQTRGRTVTIDAAEEVWLLADYSLMHQILHNLIENAAKYSSEGGGIHLSARRTGVHTTIDIADDGPGIAPDDLPHIFEKFYRGSGTTAKGTGLGLSIVKAMTVLCGGTIDVVSTASGTCFTLRLRAATAPKSSASP
jgi:two-component system sensor histidine kinase KdpD